MPTPSTSLSAPGLPAEMLDHIIDNRTKCLQKYIHEHIPDNALFCVVFFHELEKVRKGLGQSYQPDLYQRFIEKFEQFVPSNIEELMPRGPLALPEVIINPLLVLYPRSSGIRGTHTLLIGGVIRVEADLFSRDEEDDEDDIRSGPWEVPGPLAPLSPEQVKTLRAMLPTDVLELEAIKARLDNINELIDERRWELKEGFGEDEFSNRCHEFFGSGPYDRMGNLTGIWLRHSLAGLAEHAGTSKDGPLSPEERGFFQTEIYRVLICKLSRLGHMMFKSKWGNCNGQAVLCKLGRTAPRPALTGQDDLTGALEFDHVLDDSRVMRYVEVLFAPSYLDALSRSRAMRDSLDQIDCDYLASRVLPAGL